MPILPYGIWLFRVQSFPAGTQANTQPLHVLIEQSKDCSCKLCAGLWYDMLLRGLMALEIPQEPLGNFHLVRWILAV